MKRYRTPRTFRGWLSLARRYARVRGHNVGAWRNRDTDRGRFRHAVCRDCGRAVEVYSTATVHTNGYEYGGETGIRGEVVNVLCTTITAAPDTVAVYAVPGVARGA